MYELALGQEEYKKRLRPLQQHLYDLEHAVIDAKIPVIILFEGWSATGKGRLISLLVERLPRRPDHTTAHRRAAQNPWSSMRPLGSSRVCFGVGNLQFGPAAAAHICIRIQRLDELLVEPFSFKYSVSLIYLSFGPCS